MRAARPSGILLRPPGTAAAAPAGAPTREGRQSSSRSTPRRQRPLPVRRKRPTDLRTRPDLVPTDLLVGIRQDQPEREDGDVVVLPGLGHGGEQVPADLLGRGVRGRSSRAAASAPMPASRSRSRRSISPSAYRPAASRRAARRRPHRPGVHGGSAPISGAAPRRRTSAGPSGRRSSGGGCPALLNSSIPLPEPAPAASLSMTSRPKVAVASCAI